jgi:3-hydroxybenzoate 6-monooxygenase
VRGSDGTVYEADFVLAADGLKSALRKVVSTDEPVTSSYVAYRGVVSMDAAALNDDVDSVTVWLGPDSHLVQYPLRHGDLLNTVAVIKSASFGQGTEQLDGQEELLSAFAESVPAVQASLTNLWQGVRWPMFDREPIDQWLDGRVLLIGDAAHPMLQYLAQGACQALEDASVLQDLTQGTVFADGGTNPAAWPDAASAFIAVRSPRTARVQRSARVWGESWHVSGVARLLRNLLFKSSAGNVYRYADWLYAPSDHAIK